MLDLTIEVGSGPTFESFDCKIISQGEAVHRGWSIPEDAQISIQLVTTDKAFDFGEPKLYIGDILHEFALTSSDGDKHYWSILFEEDNFLGVPFRNFVGKSEIILVFQRSDIRIRNSVDIQANAVNAELAEGMLTYLNNHYDSIVSICFSRSKISGDTGKGDEDSLNRLIEEAQRGVELCESVWPELLSRIRERWETKLKPQSNSLPNSPQGIAWLTQNPESIHFCNQEEQMFKLGCYPVRISKGVSEKLIHNRDLLENRIIHAYLAHLEQKMTKAKALLVENSANKGHRGSNFDFGEYVSLDYILNKYRIPILMGLTHRLENLIFRVKLLRKKFSSKVEIPQSLKPIAPCVTPFVARTPSYLKVYEKISKWYDFGNMKIGVGDILFGLRHLSTLYEFTVLTQLISALGKTGFSLIESNWRDYNDAKFGGEVKTRPTSEINNYFYFSGPSRKMEIELFYEPKIWTKHKAQCGDPVDVCIEHQGKDWQHRKPDYLLRVWFEGIPEPILIIIDAKFSSAYRVKNDKLPELVSKYLLGLHQKKTDGSYGQLPIQAVWAIYPKGKAERINFYASYHSLGGRDCILPSLGGLRVKPGEEDRLVTMLDTLLTQLSNEFHKTVMT